MTDIMTLDQNRQGIQAMPLVQGQIDVTTGVFTDISVISCVSDGDITITWEDDTTTTKSFIENMDRTVVCKSVEVDSGTFDLA